MSTFPVYTKYILPCTSVPRTSKSDGQYPLTYVYPINVVGSVTRYPYVTIPGPPRHASGHTLCNLGVTWLLTAFSFFFPRFSSSSFFFISEGLLPAALPLLFLGHYCGRYLVKKKDREHTSQN